MRSKKHLLWPAFLLLFWSSESVMGQFVNIRLELPAGVNFVSQIIKTNIKSQGEELVWIEMAAHENISFLLSYSYTDTVQVKPLTIYFLNDGSTNFHLAEKYSGFNYFLKMHNKNLLRRDFGPVPNAWLGLPNTKNTIYYIEYN